MTTRRKDYGALHNNEEWIIPSLWMGLWNFISPGCQMFGAIAGGYLQDRLGRRWSVFIGSVLCAVGVAICFASNQTDSLTDRRVIFLVGKGIQGGAIGTCLATAQTYLSEILPPNLRGPVLAFFPIFTLLGQVIGALVIYACLEKSNGYVIAFATQWPLSLFSAIGALVVPESPTYHVRKDRLDLARNSQVKFAHPEEDVDQTVARLKVHIEHERSLAKATYQDSFRHGNGRRTWIVVFASLIPQLFGLTLMSKASYFVQIVGMKANLSVIVLILGIVVGLIANVCSMWFLNRFPRRLLILWGFAVSALLWAGMGIAGIWSGQVVVWYTAGTMILVIVTCGLSCWPASHVVASETSALHMRAKAQGIGYFAAGAGYAGFGFVLPYIFNPDQGNLRAKTGFVYAGLCVLAVVITWFYVPEMKGRTPAEIDRMFEQGLSARQFTHFVNPDAVGGEEKKAQETRSVTGSVA